MVLEKVLIKSFFFQAIIDMAWSVGHVTIRPRIGRSVQQERAVLALVVIVNDGVGEGKWLGFYPTNGHLNPSFFGGKLECEKDGFSGSHVNVNIRDVFGKEPAHTSL